MYGPHLTLDMYGCDRDKLADINFIYEFLSNLPSKIGMRKILPPYVFKYDGGEKPEDWGISGIVLIAESHISIHTYPEKNYASFDIFSCKEFEVEKTAKMVVKLFEAKSYEKNYTTRGKHFPKQLDKNNQIMALERIVREPKQIQKIKD
ncbi:MAG: adenosylmethionine decarboxylase [Candidatus Anstonellaceae archaeon]